MLVDELERAIRLAYGKAIEPFKSYALSACQTTYYAGPPFDEKVSYNAKTGSFGDRIAASEQALRRCLKACLLTGNTREASEVYSSYETIMTELFKKWGLVWSPAPETKSAWERVRVLTDAHRITLTTSQHAG